MWNDVIKYLYHHYDGLTRRAVCNTPQRLDATFAILFLWLHRSCCLSQRAARVAKDVSGQKCSLRSPLTAFDDYGLQFMSP